MQTTFLIAVALIFGVYAGYPLCITILSRLRPVRAADPSGVREWPSVSVVCAVHNEAGRLPAKIATIAAQSYPGHLQMIFISDGSSDGTESLLLADPRATVLAYPVRRGKAHALNLGVANATGDIVVFTDARQELEPGAIAVLVAQLAADDVGAVSGALVHRDPSTHEALNIGLYWRYERAIREAESRWNSTVGATGALYAIRRSDYVPIADDTILDDFEIPMLIIRRGRRALIDRRAVVCDELQTDLRGEHVRKVRTLTGNFQSLARHRWMLSPRSNPVFWQLIFHKVLRLFMPYALLVAWVTSAMSPAPAMRIAFGLQTSGYAVVAAAYVFGNLKRVPGLGALVVFVDLNMAAVQALFRYAAGAAVTRWEKTS